MTESLNLNYERVKAFVLSQRLPTLNIEGVSGMSLEFSNSDNFSNYTIDPINGLSAVYDTITDLGYKEN